jgi:uncharacterized membrane protein
VRFPWQKKKTYFNEEETQLMLEAVRKAEQQTSGEVRVFVESKCRFVDAMDRAKELFIQLRMYETVDRNATLIYVAVDDHQFAILGDEGIHKKVGDAYWNEEVNKMLMHFKHSNLVNGICQAIVDLGEALHHYFPYNHTTDKNELPDEIVFGR